MIKKILRLLKSVREYKKYAIIAPIIVGFEVMLEVLIPFVMAKLIDEGINASSLEKTYLYGGILFISAMFALVFGIIAGIASAKASSGFAKNLRKDLYYKVQTFSFSNIDKFSTSSIVTRCTTDVSNVQMAFQMLIRVAIRAPLMLIFSLIMAFTINRKISLIFLVLVPVLATVVISIGRMAFPVFESVFHKYDELNNVVEENVAGVRVVKSYILEDEENAKFKNKSKQIYDLFTKAQKIVSFNQPTMQLCVYGAIIFISWIGARTIVLSGGTALSTGELTSLITYSIQILASVMILSMILVMSTIATAAMERIYEILNEIPELSSPENAIKEVKDGSIEFKNVSFSYVNDKNKEVLKNINIKINSGETIGIIGGTGDGKSSLVNLIPRLYDVTEGELLVGGKNVKKYDIEVLRDAVSCVLQQNVLFSGTIKENLRWGNKDATDEELIEACKLAQADSFIQEFPDKYDTMIAQGGTNVSGGQKQRLCIARALLKKPKILILDDSTSAVDTKTDQHIRNSFNDKIPNTTKIIIAQRVASVQESDKIIVLDNGNIDGFGTHDELMRNNKIYQEVYESQTKVGDDNA